MPVLFLGHGSPMNAIEENEFVDGFRAIGSAVHNLRLGDWQNLDKDNYAYDKAVGGSITMTSVKIG